MPTPPAGLAAHLHADRRADLVLLQKQIARTFLLCVPTESLWLVSSISQFPTHRKTSFTLKVTSGLKMYTES